MRFEFLGTGTSAGVPTIGCACDVCTSDDPRDTRLRTSALVRFTDARGQDRAVLLDAGPDLRQQVLRAGLDRLDGILFTHNHVDHTFGLDEVRRFNVTMNAPVHIYAEDHTLDHLRRVYKHIFDRDANVQDSFVATLVANRLEPGSAIELHGLKITPFRLLHGRLPILGFRLEPASPAVTDPGGVFPLAYCTDVSAFPPEAWGVLEGTRTLVLDALRRRRHPTHLTLDQALSVADRVGADRTWLVHMSHDLAHGPTNAQLPEGVALAHDGLVLGG